MKRKQIIYALYDGEEIIAEGTKQQIAEQTGLSMNTLGAYHTPAVQARGNRALVNVGVEGDEYE